MTTWLEKLEVNRGMKYIYKNSVLASFPKCGRTWVRMVLAKLLQIKDISVKDNEMLYAAHKTPDVIEERFGYDTNVIYLKREPGDVILSYVYEIYNDNAARGIGWPKKGVDKHGIYTISPALINTVMNSKDGVAFAFKYIHNPAKRGPSNFESLDSLVNFYNSWETNLEKFNSSLILIYEDLLLNPYQEFNKIIDFLKFECTEKELREAIEFSSFKNMKKIDNDPRKGIDVNINPLLYHKGNFHRAKDRVRRGEHRAYLDEFPDEIIKIIEEAKNKLIVKYE